MQGPFSQRYEWFSAPILDGALRLSASSLASPGTSAPATAASRSLPRTSRVTTRPLPSTVLDALTSAVSIAGLEPPSTRCPELDPDDRDHACRVLRRPARRAPSRLPAPATWVGSAATMEPRNHYENCGFSTSRASRAHRSFYARQGGDAGSTAPSARSDRVRLGALERVFRGFHRALGAVARGAARRLDQRHPSGRLSQGRGRPSRSPGSDLLPLGTSVHLRRQKVWPPRCR